MPVVRFKFSSVDATLTNGVITLWSPRLRPGGLAAITSEKRESLLVNGEAELDLEPGPVVGHVTGDGATHQLKFTVPSQDDPVEFLDLLEKAYSYSPEVVQAAQQAAREARAAAQSAAESASVVGSAERVLEAESASVSAQSAAESARDAASSSASASTSSASDSAAARDAAVAAQEGSESAKDTAVLAQGDAAASADRAAERAEYSEECADVSRGYNDTAWKARLNSISARDASVAAKDDAVIAKDSAQASATAAQRSADAAALSEGVAVTAASDAANGVRDDLSGLVSTAEGHASDASDSAAAAARSAQDAASVVSDGVPDASTTMKGKVQLAGDLSGTADAPTVPELATKADTGHAHEVADVTGLQSDLNGKVSASSTGTRLYGTDSGGNHTLVQYANTATENSVAVRGANGTLPVGAPTAGEHATTKDYVDTSIASKLRVVDELPSSPDPDVLYLIPEV